MCGKSQIAVRDGVRAPGLSKGRRTIVRLALAMALLDWAACVWATREFR